MESYDYFVLDVGCFSIVRYVSVPCLQIVRHFIKYHLPSATKSNSPVEFSRTQYNSEYTGDIYSGDDYYIFYDAVGDMIHKGMNEIGRRDRD